MAKQKLPRYVQRRHQSYYFVIEIPEGLRKHYPGSKPGVFQTRIVKSLKTQSLNEAAARALILAGQYKDQFDKLKNSDDPAAFYRHLLKTAKTDIERLKAMEQIEEKHGELASPSIGYADGIEPSIEDIQGAEEAALAVADEFVERATATVLDFDELVDDWLARADMNITDKAKDEYRSAIRNFTKTCPTLADVTAASVQDWVDGAGVAPATLNKRLSALRGYWSYLQLPNVGASPKDFKPFDDIRKPKKAKNGNGDERKPFNSGDIIKLRVTSLKDKPLHNLIGLAMFTGARIEELCSLKCADVHEDYFDITDAKSAAGVRQVPIHRNIKGLVTDLQEASTDGYLLSGLSAENKYGNRSSAIGKRFGRLKVRLGYGPDYVFHSIRKTVATLLENAGVPENVAADIIGHDKPSMTYGLYSGGASLAVKAEAINKLNYRKPNTA